MLSHELTTADNAASTLPTRLKTNKSRKSGLNRNREGSVRRINKKIYLDFLYFGERVRENSDMLWSDKNAKIVRDQLDRIIAAINAGTLRFSEVFPRSKGRERFAEREKAIHGNQLSPDQVKCGEYFDQWYLLRKESGRITGRTLWGYSRYLSLYLKPFFGDKNFSELNSSVFEQFIGWAKKQCYKKTRYVDTKTDEHDFQVGNATLNKVFTVLKMVCKQAAITYGWKEAYDPFYGFRKLAEDDPYEKINPFNKEEREGFFSELPEHYHPYFQFAFCSGLRAGEQIALKAEDIDWGKNTIRIRRAMTRDENGKSVIGLTKNKYSQREINILPSMREALAMQVKICEALKSEYLFCTANGTPVHLNNLRRGVWIPTLKRAGLEIREIKQTRHTFATTAISCGENPLWIAKVMGHRNTEMIIKVYAKYVKGTGRSDDGNALDKMFSVAKEVNGSKE